MRLEWCSHCLGIRLGFLAFVTPFNISFNVFSDGRPIVFGLDQVLGSSDSRMSCEGMVVILLYDFFSQSIVFWDIQKFLVVESLIDFFPLTVFFGKSFGCIFLSFVL